MDITKRLPNFPTDESQYIAEVMGDELVKGLNEVVEKKPEDAISHLATFLYQQATIQEHRKNMQKGEETNIDKIIEGRIRDEHGQSILHFAASRPHGRSAYYQLIKKSGCSVAERDSQYRTPRDVASSNGLQENVASIDMWVLDLAVHGKSEELEKLLLMGYDHILDVEDEDGRDILQAAERAKQKESVKVLKSVVPFEEKREWLHQAIRLGSIGHVKDVLDDLKIATALNYFSRCSLHVATLVENLDIIELIVKAFPKTVLVGDNLGRTSLHYAMGLPKVDMIGKILVKAGAKRSQDLKERTPSYYFIDNTDITVLKNDEEGLVI